MEQRIMEKTTRLFCEAVTHRVTQPALAELEKDALTEVQLLCIRFVHLHPEPSVGAIAEGLNISNAASAKLIDRLVKKRLLLREEDPKDRRVLKIKLTPAGDALLSQITQIETQQLNQILRRMPAEEFDALQRGLISFLKAALLKAEEVEEICLRCGIDHSVECPGNLRYHELTGENKTRV
ncbi:MAG TPA: MarR family transcriptional regulator [Bacillota bacterium]|nr:MarR family transcriptional regulator [Bacillota bacterium]